MSRNQEVFARLAQHQEGALVPYLVVGYPTPEVYLFAVDAIVRAGADGLMLTVPFSDPVADGPACQLAHIDARKAGVSITQALDLVAQTRQQHRDIPISLVIYANVAHSLGTDVFYATCAKSGIDAVLIPDVPIREALPFSQPALQASVSPLYIAPPNASPKVLREVVQTSRDFVFGIAQIQESQDGSGASVPGLDGYIASIRAHGDTPILVQADVHTPEQVQLVIKSGVEGVITGDVVATTIAQTDLGPAPSPDEVRNLQHALETKIGALKAATKNN